MIGNGGAVGIVRIVGVKRRVNRSAVSGGAIVGKGSETPVDFTAEFVDHIKQGVFRHIQAVLHQVGIAGIRGAILVDCIT